MPTLLEVEDRLRFQLYQDTNSRARYCSLSDRLAIIRDILNEYFAFYAGTWDTFDIIGTDDKLIGIFRYYAPGIVYFSPVDSYAHSASLIDRYRGNQAGLRQSYIFSGDSLMHATAYPTAMYVMFTNRHYGEISLSNSDKYQLLPELTLRLDWAKARRLFVWLNSKF